MPVKFATLTGLAVLPTALLTKPILTAQAFIPCFPNSIFAHTTSQSALFKYYSIREDTAGILSASGEDSHHMHSDSGEDSDHVHSDSGEDDTGVSDFVENDVDICSDFTQTPSSSDMTAIHHSPRPRHSTGASTTPPPTTLEDTVNTDLQTHIVLNPSTRTLRSLLLSLRTNSGPLNALTLPNNMRMTR
ncbi:hypothetical protein SARC_09250 [Sphaeroforma arctica JP610]|uniref:Uncharacterized protein n=1 Tax=Sphaeroforma arctica JP610 TaxID=667725 RepID=A0A0L0FNL1_9EUKA|nr:hypothetical protein SARC_09250 [Sphaeroforma arctica JP610]KNC78314.1 hypothetical protein SARC_09250 [Sphaeroforma arctica JP610]|eukprot:XP_014152216.1 hypothetical protein SARC_09250 [Sphaeroforma arctica JP610]